MCRGVCVTLVTVCMEKLRVAPHKFIPLVRQQSVSVLQFPDDGMELCYLELEPPHVSFLRLLRGKGNRRRGGQKNLNQKKGAHAGGEQVVELDGKEEVDGGAIRCHVARLMHKYFQYDWEKKQLYDLHLPSTLYIKNSCVFIQIYLYYV